MKARLMKIKSKDKSQIGDMKKNISLQIQGTKDNKQVQSCLCKIFKKFRLGEHIFRKNMILYNRPKK